MGHIQSILAGDDEESRAQVGKLSQAKASLMSRQIALSEEIILLKQQKEKENLVYSGVEEAASKVSVMEKRFTETYQILELQSAQCKRNI